MIVALGLVLVAGGIFLVWYVLSGGQLPWEASKT